MAWGMSQDPHDLLKQSFKDRERRTERGRYREREKRSERERER